MPKKVTTQDVADYAGVSRGSVDRVLKNRPHVSESVRIRVMDAINKTGYLTPQEENRRILYTSGNERMLLGVMVPNFTGHFEWEIMKGIENAKDELSEFKVDVRVRQCSSGYPDEVLSILSDMEEEGVSGIAICSIDDSLIREKIDELEKKGIPVITYNSDLKDSKRLLFVGQDHMKSGRVAGDIMCKLIRPGEKIIAACGNREFTSHRDRITGFLEICAEKGIERDRIVCIETFNDYSITLKKISDLLSLDDYSGIYMANRSVSGCVRAIEDRGLAGKIHLVCHDISEKTVELLSNGLIDFSISQDIYEQGYLPLILLKNYIQKGSIPNEEEIIERQTMNIVCSENYSYFNRKS